MKKVILLSIALLGLLNASAFAQWDWHYSAFDGSNPFDDAHNNKSPIDYPTIGLYPSPGLNSDGGDGGELYDLEGITVIEDADFIYVAVANSFGTQAHSPSWNTYHDIGDLFIKVNGAADFGYAVNLNSLAGVLPSQQDVSGQVGFMTVDSWDAIPSTGGTYSNYASIVSQVGPFSANGDQLSLIDYFMGYDAAYESGALASDLPPDNTTQTYVWELRIDKSLLGAFSTLDFQLTLACGNDLVYTTHNAIPEPTTLALFAVGLLGAGFVRKRFK
jgi:hypothetical protein